MFQRTILLIGHTTSCEFQAAVLWLTRCARVHVVPTVATACSHLKVVQQRDHVDSDSIILLQSRPGQFSAAEIEQLHRCQPLASLYVLVGSWCEGEPRSGNCWPGVARIYWYDWEARFERLFGRTLSDEHGWRLPRTFTEVEASLATRSTPPTMNRGIVAVRALEPEGLASLMDGLCGVGFKVDSCSTETALRPGTQVVVWDMVSGSQTEWERLQAGTKHVSPVPVIALLGWPRWEEWEWAKTVGVTALIAKPFAWNDLMFRLSAALSPLVEGEAPTSPGLKFGMPQVPVRSIKGRPFMEQNGAK